MNDQMIRVISSPSSSTTGLFTLISATGGRCYLAGGLADRPGHATISSGMATVERRNFGNHEVANQPPPLVDYNLFAADTVLGEAVRREGADWDLERITAVGEYAGSEAAQE